MIGDGGTGTVYEARHEVLGTAVALKFLHAELARRAGLAQRFLQEARVSANIQSIHVTRVTDVDMTQDGTPYLVMELLHGESLQQLIDRRGKLLRTRPSTSRSRRSRASRRRTPSASCTATSSPTMCS